MNHRSQLTAFALIGTLLGATVAANAQATSAPGADTAPAHRGHRGVMARAMEGIQLTPDEKSQIKTAEQNYKASRKTSTPETREQLKGDIEAALTPDQRTQFESNVKSIRAQMRADRKNGAPAAGTRSPNS